MPRGMPLPVESHTRTEREFSPPFKNLVMSNENGVYPPVCSPIFSPFTNTSAFQSTAPKFKSTFLPFQSSGTLNLRSYHRLWSPFMDLPTPESDDSIANGTRIFPSNDFGSGASFFTTA